MPNMTNEPSPNADVLVLNKTEARTLIFGDYDGWETVEVQTRKASIWNQSFIGIFFHKATTQYFRLEWEQGSTEMEALISIWEDIASSSGLHCMTGSMQEKPFQHVEPDPVRDERSDALYGAFCKLN